MEGMYGGRVCAFSVGVGPSWRSRGEGEAGEAGADHEGSPVKGRSGVWGARDGATIRVGGAGLGLGLGMGIG